MHPSVIIDGYQKACEFALSELASISLLQHLPAHRDNLDGHHDSTKMQTTNPLASATTQTANDLESTAKQTTYQNISTESESEGEQTTGPSDELLHYLTNTALHSKGISS